MASRFVSGGAIDAVSGEAVAPAEASPPLRQQTARKQEWEAAQKELEDDRRRREEQRRADAAGGEKSLFDILQANKAAKQTAFEEANKIKNQFRALDDDEVEFLESVNEAGKAAEERVRRETEEGLGRFREEQLRKEREVVAGGGGVDEGDDGEQGEEWQVGGGRKRKRREEKGIKGLKRRGSAVEREDGKDAGEDVSRKASNGDAGKTVTEKPATSAQAPITKPKMGLVEYGSDSDDE